jgi:signal transduction histidine kinase
MDRKKTHHSRIENHLILIGILFSIVYWLLDSVIKAYIFYEGPLAEQLIPRNADELWIRTLVVTILLMFATYVQFLFTRLRKAEENLQKTREEFIAMLIHDLKSPLASMMAYTQLIQDPRKGEIPRDKLEFAGIIYKSGEVMSGMINNMVNASKIEAGQLEFHFEDFLLESLIREIKRVFDPLAIPSGIALDFQCPDGCWVHGDRNKLRQVFYNLISNALRYTPQGGRVYITVTASGSKVTTIEVGDSGRGIPESEQSRIFQKFTQARGECHGTGLGLYIVKNYLQGHGTEISLRSQEGHGAHFTFSLSPGKKPETVPLQSQMIPS